MQLARRVNLSQAPKEQTLTCPAQLAPQEQQGLQVQAYTVTRAQQGLLGTRGLLVRKVSKAYPVLEVQVAVVPQDQLALPVQLAQCLDLRAQCPQSNTKRCSISAPQVR